MARECYVCGKKPGCGRSIARRGMARSMGGVGVKITGKTMRRFLPNIQTVAAVIGGKTKRVKVCAKCLKAGKIKKAA